LAVHSAISSPNLASPNFKPCKHIFALAPPGI
jgi:hypothetical protein